VTQAARRRGVVATAVALPVFLLGCTFCVGGLAKNEWHGDVPHYETFGAKVKDGQVPYHDFYLEYPPGALPVFVAPAVISERHYVKTFKLLMAALGAATIVGSALILALLDADYPRYGVALGTMALAPPLLGHIYLNRYDPWPALLVTFALLCLLVPRVRLAAALLALAFTAKIYAAAALPIAALRIWRTRARELLAAAVTFVVVAAVVALPFAAVAFGGLGFSFYTQSTRPLQTESLGASLLLVADRLGLYHTHMTAGKASSIDLKGAIPNAVGVLTSLVVIASVLAVAWRYLRGDADRERTLTAFAAAISGYVAFFKVFSPQYVTWLVPLVPLVWGRLGRLATSVFVLVMLLTQIELYGWTPVHGVRGTNLIVGEPRAWLPWVLLLRNLLLVGVLWLLLQALRPATALARAPAAQAAPAAASGLCSDPNSREITVE
jgi:hypothetical protein